MAKKNTKKEEELQEVAIFNEVKMEATPMSIEKEVKIEKVLNSSQAFDALSINKRLRTFVLKKYSEKKGLSEWRATFENDGVK